MLGLFARMALFGPRLDFRARCSLRYGGGLTPRSKSDSQFSAITLVDLALQIATQHQRRERAMIFAEVAQLALLEVNVLGSRYLIGDRKSVV